jgi:hypothetical protein
MPLRRNVATGSPGRTPDPSRISASEAEAACRADDRGSALVYQIAPISTNMVLAYVAQHVLGLPRSY